MFENFKNEIADRVSALLAKKMDNDVKNFPIDDPMIENGETITGEVLTPEERQARAGRQQNSTATYSFSTIAGDGYDNPDDVVKKYGLSAYAKMRHDDQIKPILKFRKTSMLASEWFIKAYDEEDEASKKQAEFVAWCLTEGLHGQSLMTILEEMLSAMDFGYSTGELIWYVTDWGDYKGTWCPKRVRVLYPDNVRYNVDRYDDITENGVLIKPAGGTSRKPYPLEKFLIYSHNKEFGNVYGCSELRAAYRSWYAKDKVIKFHSLYLERFGVPIIAVKEEAYETDSGLRAKIDTWLRKLTVLCGVRLPKTVDIQIIGGEKTAGSGDAFIKAINLHNKMIARSVLASDLFGFTDMENGSRAVADTQQEPWIWTTQFDRQKFIDEVINYKLIPLIIDYNFPDVSGYPRLEMADMKSEALEALTKVWESLKRLGAFDSESLEDINTVRIKAGLPPIQEKIDEVPDDDNPSDPDEPDEPDETGNPESSDSDSELDPDEAKMMKVKTVEEFAASPLTPGERRVNLAETISILDLAEANIRRVTTKYWGIHKDAVIQKIRDTIESGASPDFGKMTLPKMADFKKEISAIFKELWDDGQTSIQAELAPIIEQRNLIAPEGYIPFDAIEFVNQKAAQYSTTEAARIIAVGQQGFIEGMIKGYTIDEITEYINLNAENSLKVLTGASVRTGVSAIYNGGRMLEIQTLGPVIVPGYQISAIIDDRTTDQCQELDQLRFRADSSDAWTFVPPFHFQCRTIIVPITMLDEAEFPGLKYVQDDEALMDRVNAIYEELIPVGFGGGVAVF